MIKETISRVIVTEDYRSDEEVNVRTVIGKQHYENSSSSLKQRG